MSSRDGLVPLVKVVFGLGMAGADGMGDFSLKRSGVGQDGWWGGGQCRGCRGCGGILLGIVRGLGSVL